MRLDQKIQLYVDDLTPDGQGGYNKVTTLLREPWARVLPLRGQEGELARQRTTAQTYDIYVRSTTPVEMHHWITWQGIKLRIIAAPPAPRQAYRKLTVEEIRT